MHISPDSFRSAAEVAARHEARVRRILHTLSVILVLVGLFWGAVFAWHNNWVGVTFEIIAVAVGAFSFVLLRRQHAFAASLLTIGMSYLLLCMGFLQDVPTPNVARSAHFFFLPLGMASLVLFRTGPKALKHGMPIAALIGFTVLGSTTWGWDSTHQLSDAIRAPGTWINGISVMAMLYLLIRIVQTDMREDSGLLADLRAAVETPEQFELHYQPQVRVDGRVICAEALVRWNHPTRGRVSPGEFIPLAEQSGLILPLGAWILDEACAQLQRWSTQPGWGELTIAVNVSAEQFRQPDFLEQVHATLRRTGARAQCLKIELTESMLANDLPVLIEKMQQLRAMGVHISLDDFGTGFSSLNYLKNLPLDQLKLDQSFVKDVLEDANDQAIVRTVIELGLSLELEIIAEGVETAAQRDCLSALGCPTFQGYLFSRPLPTPEFERFMQRQARPAHHADQTASDPTGR